MENLYQLLECTDKNTHEEIKKAFQRLALKYHPDKQKFSEEKGDRAEHHESTESGAHFIRINEAWKILGDAVLRKQFDARWKQRCLVQDWPIQDEVEFEDFEICDNPEDSECSESKDTLFMYPCRCGGTYAITDTDVVLKFDIVCCDTCSLAIRVIYS